MLDLPALRHIPTLPRLIATQVKATSLLQKGALMTAKLRVGGVVAPAYNETSDDAGEEVNSCALAITERIRVFL